jgi:hypothetical protein
LPDGESEIFFATGLDSFSADLPVGQIGPPFRRTSKPVATINRWAALRSDERAGVDRALRAPATSAAQNLQIDAVRHQRYLFDLSAASVAVDREHRAEEAGMVKTIVRLAFAANRMTRHRPMRVAGWLLALLAVLFAAGSIQASRAEGYPERTLKIVVPFPLAGPPMLSLD